MTKMVKRLESMTFFRVHSIWVLFMLFLVTSCAGNSLPPLELNDDVLGLIVFKSELRDPTSSLQSWNEDDANPCSWEYVKCNPNNGRVTRVSLNGLNLSGKIGRGLEKLQYLKFLSLAHNNISGNISKELSLINGLESLDLSYNRLSGTIPISFGDMSSIKFLDLSENTLSGSIPEQLFKKCSSLRFLSLAGNFFEGSIPRTLNRCSYLGGLNLSHNHLSGMIDFNQNIWPLNRMRVLDLSHNAFSGEVSKGVSSLHYIKELNLQRNLFSGTLPFDLGLCSHLNRLDVSFNMFSGSLPDSLQKLNSLTLLRLSGNRLSGDLPWWITSLSNLQHIDFSNNEFSGVVPENIGDLKSLSFFSVSNNKLMGKIPESLAQINGISVIRMRENNFDGVIPVGLFDLGLEEIDLSSNGFTGSIPPGSSNLFESLSRLDLSENRLSGDIPAEMGLFFKLKYLNLSWNNLCSRLPPEIGYFKGLSILDLRNNIFYGSIPEDLCDSNSLSVLQLDGNSLTGPIPFEIGNCSSLHLLSLSHNDLNGSIPESMVRLKNLEILKLEFNSLSGEIPPQLGNLDNLLAVNISHNRLVGRLPVHGVFPSLDQSALQGNLGLCSPLLTEEPCKMNVPKPLVLDPDAYNRENGGNSLPKSNDSMRFGRRRFLSVSAIIAISASALIFMGVLMVFLLNVSAQRKMTMTENPMESMCSTSPKSRVSSMGKLVMFSPTSRSRTEDWVRNAETIMNDSSEIGRGAFGTVYKASIGDNRMVVIRRLVSSNIIQYREDFDREIQILGKAKHPNVMSLKGYYWTPQLQLLISDFTPNGSLHSKLHERPANSPSLSWSNRFKIAIGTAKGLAYLHQSFRPPIIHYNLKPTNILLDENFNPMISDFGLARLLPKLDKHIISSRFQSALGYVAPELACQSLRINEKCDIYGFGVIILELITGKKAMEYGEDDVVVLSDHIKVMLERGNVLECVDQTMKSFPEEEVLPVLKLGLVCTSQIPSSRPSMAEIVQVLQVIKTPVPDRN